MNTPQNISTREWTRQLEPREICARDCEDYCEHPAIADTWLSSADKWFCDDCLVYYFMDELESIIGRCLTERMVFIAHSDDLDEFAFFRVIDESGDLLDITLDELERVSLDFHAIMGEE